MTRGRPISWASTCAPSRSPPLRSVRPSPGSAAAFMHITSASSRLTIVLYVLLGGTQTAIGPLLGAAVFTLLPEVLRASANWRYVAFAAALIVIMALRPEGLVTGAQLRRLLGANRAEPRRAIAAGLPKGGAG